MKVPFAAGELSNVFVALQSVSRNVLSEKFIASAVPGPAVAANAKILTTDSTTASGLRWADIPAVKRERHALRRPKEKLGLTG